MRVRTSVPYLIVIAAPVVGIKSIGKVRFPNIAFNKVDLP